MYAPGATVPGGHRGNDMPASTGIAEAQHRDLYFYGLYRVLEAGLSLIHI